MTRCRSYETYAFCCDVDVAVSLTSYAQAIQTGGQEAANKAASDAAKAAADAANKVLREGGSVAAAAEAARNVGKVRIAPLS